MSKQDRQGVRTAAEIEQKYGLGQFMHNQNQKNQDLAKGISNLGDSFSVYKTENDQNISKLKENTDSQFKKVSEAIGGVSKEINSLSKAIFDMVYPVGAIYVSVSETDPSVLFGGTWEQIKDTFLLASGNTYSAGETGGEATHTLTENEMPSHKHYPEGYTNPGSESAYLRRFSTNLDHSSDSVARTQIATGSSGKYAVTATTSGDLNECDTTASTGGSEAHNNMPPYLAVYVWKRTA